MGLGKMEIGERGMGSGEVNSTDGERDGHEVEDEWDGGGEGWEMGQKGMGKEGERTGRWGLDNGE